MADVLSQNEIDALLSALSTGELEPEQLQKEDEKQKVKIYDFKSPQKFSKDHIRTLELIHDNYARIVTNYLTAQLRRNVKVKVETVEQITYEEFIHSIQNPTVLTMFKMPPLTGNILLEINSQMSFMIIDLLLGGSGERKSEVKEFSDIDKNIMYQITSGMIMNLQLAWEDILHVEPEVEGLETNPALNQTLAPNEPVALITFSVELNKNTTFINMCIPYLSIEKVVDVFVVQHWFHGAETELEEESRVKMEEGLQKVEIELSAQLGSTHLSIDEFLRLNTGDVIRLDNKSSSPIKVLVDEEECFYAKPGNIGKNLGVAVLDIIDKEVIANE